MTRNRSLVLLPILLLLASEARADWPYATTARQSNLIHQDTRMKDLDPFFFQSAFFPGFGDGAKVTTIVQRYPSDPKDFDEKKAKGKVKNDYSCVSSQITGIRNLGSAKDKFDVYGNAATARRVAGNRNCDVFRTTTTFAGNQKQPEGFSVNVMNGVQRLPPDADSDCYDLNTLCLGERGRFKVEVDWSDFDGVSGKAVAMASGFDSGTFWFFNADNTELLVKVLDACGVGGSNRFWVFYAATTNVEFTLNVTDTQTDLVSTYFNPLGVQSPAITDTGAFATCP